MKAELKKVYYCDYCKKHSISASTISRHEKYCKMNPKNAHKCFEFCRYLKRDRTTHFNDEGEAYGRKTEFTCMVTDNKMYSFLLEKRDSLYPYHNILKGLTRMPLECKLFHALTWDELEDRQDKKAY